MYYKASTCLKGKDRIKISNNSHSTRSRNYLVEERSKTDFGLNDIIIRGIRNFNNFSNHYNPSISKLSYKKKIEQQLKTLCSTWINNYKHIWLNVS